MTTLMTIMISLGLNKLKVKVEGEHFIGITFHDQRLTQ